VQASRPHFTGAAHNESGRQNFGVRRPRLAGQPGKEPLGGPTSQCLLVGGDDGYRRVNLISKREVVKPDQADVSATAPAERPQHPRGDEVVASEQRRPMNAMRISRSHSSELPESTRKPFLPVIR